MWDPLKKWGNLIFLSATHFLWPPSGRCRGSQKSLGNECTSNNLLCVFLKDKVILQQWLVQFTQRPGNRRSGFSSCSFAICSGQFSSFSLIQPWHCKWLEDKALIATVCRTAGESCFFQGATSYLCKKIRRCLRAAKGLPSPENPTCFCLCWT